MALSVLNNIPSMVAQDNLSVTNNNLQSTLFQLSSGSRINSGADDPAGLSIANGLQSNITALQQSSQNATEGVGLLQVADGALSQVTTLLNRAVTLATEASNGGLTQNQYTAITNEYNSITAEINRIGEATTFNGTSVFQSATVTNPNVTDSQAGGGLAANTVLTPAKQFTLNLGSTSYTWTPGTSATTYAYESEAPSALGSTSALTAGQTITIANGQGTMNWTAGPTTYTGGNVLSSGYATALSSASTLTVANNKGSVSFTEGNTDGTTVGGLINYINQNGAQYGISATLNSSSNLVISGTTAGGELTLTGTEFGTSYTDLGTMTGGTGSTVANLETAINGSGLGLSASLVNGNVQIASSQAGGAITSVTNTVSALGTVAATSTVQDLMNWINGGNAGTGVTAGLATVSSASQLVITDTQNRNDLLVTSYDTALGAGGTPTSPTNAFVAPTMSGAGSVSVFISDGATNSSFNTIGVSIGALSSTTIGSNSPNLGSQNLQTGPSSALTVINGAISDVAEMRGVIGAGINRLSSATNVINTQIQNLTSAQSSIQDANIGQVVSNLSKYQVLEQTGIASLAQANSQEQAVLKLL